MNFTLDDIMQQTRWPGMCWKNPDDATGKAILQGLRRTLVENYLENRISDHEITRLIVFMQQYAWFTDSPELGVKYVPYTSPIPWAPRDGRHQPELIVKGYGKGSPPSDKAAESWAKRHIQAIMDAVEELQTGKPKWMRRGESGLQL